MRCHLGYCRQNETRGQSVIEFALVIPIMMLLLVGILSFAPLYSYKIRLDGVTREAARLGATGTGNLDVTNFVRNNANVPGSGTDCGATPTGSPCLSVAINPADGSRPIGGQLVVTVRYDAYVTVPIPGLFTNPKTTYSRSVARIESSN